MDQINFDDFAVRMKNFNNYSLSLSHSAMAELDDETLAEVLRVRVLHVAEAEYNFDFVQALQGMSSSVRTAFILFCFDAEIQNGGLCQFFVNSTRETAPYVSEALRLTGADEYASIFDEFCADTGIDLNDLSSFIIDDSIDYEAQTERYPFDQFDDDYYMLYEEKPLEQYIARYARAHLSAF